MENGQCDQRSMVGHSPLTVHGEKKPIKLLSPGGGDPLIFLFNQPELNHLISLDILDIIRVIMNEYPEVEAVVQNFCKLEEVDVYNYSAIRSLCKKFNKAINQMLKNNDSKPPQTFMNKDLLRQVVTRCYNKAVDNEKALNKHYEAFSSQTYGETSYDRMQMILDEIQPTSEDVFVDLGSGVGQLVVHVAGASNVKKAIGIEIAQLPAKFAKNLELEFRKWMNWYGKAYSPFKLDHGDFLDEKYRDLITQEATIIFINNYAFQADLETRIKMELLRELKDGTRIISTKPYVPLNKGAITDRQLNDISVIIDITELKQCPNPCSWTSAYVPYYMHVINRAKLERYFLSRNPAFRGRSNDGNRRSSTPSSKTSNSRESSVGLKDKEINYKNSRLNLSQHDENGYGPTTRRKWQDYISELEQQKRKKSDNGNENGETNVDNGQNNLADNIVGFNYSNMSSAEVRIKKKTNDDDDDDDSDIPIRKKPKRSHEKKKEKGRGRPKKTDGSNNKNFSVFSDDAKEGIELMHQMTKAVSIGGSADPALILADLTGQRQKQQSHFHNPNQPGSSTDELMPIPFPNVSTVSSSSKQDSTNQTNNRIFGKTYSSKYPNLDKFLTELRHLYENFLDSMHTPEFVQTLVDKINLEKTKKEELFINVNSLPVSKSSKVKDEISTTNIDLLEKVKKLGNRSEQNGNQHLDPHFGERIRNILDAHKRIRSKWSDLDNEITNFNSEMEQLLLDYQRHCENFIQKEELEQQMELQRKEREARELQGHLLAQQKQQEEEFLNNLAKQQLLQQPAQSLFPPAVGQIVMSDLAHHYSQLMVNRNPLISQLNNLLNAVTVGNSGQVNVDLSTLQALQAVAVAANNTNSSSVGSAISTLSPVGSLHQSPNMATAAAMVALSSPPPNLPTQLSQSTVQQQPMMQSFLSSLDLSNLNDTINGNNSTSGVIAGTSSAAPITNSTELRSPVHNSASISDNLNNNINHSYVQQQSALNNKFEGLLAAALSPLISTASSTTTSSVQSTSTISVNSALISSSSSLNTINATADSFDEQSTVAAVVAAVAAGGSKKSRNRSSASSKRNPQCPKQQEDPIKQEEIERQIQVIVAKALEVDSAAKCAEKERKARSGEKRSKDRTSSASLSIPASNFAGASATVTANYSGNSTKKRNSGEMILSPTSSVVGSYPSNTVSSPTISAKIISHQQSFPSSASTQLSTPNNLTISSPLCKPISIVSVAPPPHSPPQNSSEAPLSNATTIQSGYANILPFSLTTPPDSASVLNEKNFISNSASLDVGSSSMLSKTVKLSISTSSKPQTTMYVPLSTRTVMENLQFSLQPSVSPSKTTVNLSQLSMNASNSIKIEERSSDGKSTY